MSCWGAVLYELEIVITPLAEVETWEVPDAVALVVAECEMVVVWYAS